MFIGHFALGYAAKRWAPGLSLGVLFAAAQFADLLWPILVAVGIEQVRIAPGFTAATPLEFIRYPYSHSLLALAVLGLAFGWIGVWRTSMSPRLRRRSALVLAALVVSHWGLDAVTHVPDMPLYPSGPEVGMGLWRSVPGTLALESAMFVAGVWIYASSTRALDRAGRWGFAGLAGFLFIGFLANVASGMPPPSVTALWTTALALGALTLAWGWWADAHRAVR